MKLIKLILAVSLLVCIHTLFAQIYKCGVSVNNYLTEENSNYIRSVCSDRNGNIFHIRNSAIYKNKIEWVHYKPSSSTRYFSFPVSITTDKNGNVYVFDVQKYALYKITPLGQVTLVAGVEGQSGSKDTVLLKSTFSSSVTAICADSTGNIFIAEKNKIRKVSTEGYVSTFAGGENSGNANGQGKDALFNYLTGITCDKNGNIYTVESGNDIVRKVTSDSIVSDFAGGKAIYTYIDDNALKAGFNYMQGIIYGHDQHIYVSEYNGGKIRRIAPDGQVITFAGYKNKYGGAGATIGEGHLTSIVNPSVITQTPDGAIYVLAQYYGNYTSQQYQVIRKITVDESCEAEKMIVSTVCGDGYMNATVPGNGRASEFQYINGIAKDKSGNIYIAEQNTRNILKMKPNGDVSIFYTFVSNSNEPVRALAIDAAGVIYASLGDRIGVIQSDGTFVKYLNDKVDARFAATRMVFDKNGDLIFTDMYYDNIRKMNVTTGVFTTIAGGTNTAYSHIQYGYVDGPASSSRFYSPIGIDIDKDGNIFIADAGNGVVRKLSTDGNVSTLAGGPYGSEDGKGKLAQFGTISGLQLDDNGTIYVSDTEFHLIKKITFPDTNVVTIAGNIYANDGESSRYIDGKASMSRFSYPTDLVLDENNDLYIADELNSVVRKITGLSSTVTSIFPSQNPHETSALHFSPNPSSQMIYFDQERQFSICDLSGKTCLSGNSDKADISTLPNGMYLIIYEGVNKTEKLIKN